MTRPKGSKNKREGIAPFEITHEADILRETPDGDFVTNNFVPVGGFLATARIAGKTYTAEGATLEDAILNLKPEAKKGVMLLAVEHEGKKIEKIISGRIVHNLFEKYVGRFTREIAIKNIKTIFSF